MTARPMVLAAPFRDDPPVSNAVKTTERPHTTVEPTLLPANVNVRIKIAALWTSMLFVFAYVDIFSLYRPDVRAALDRGTVGDFTVDQAFLVATTAYVLIPSVMVFCALVLPPQLNRIMNIAVSTMCATTVIIGAIGEWTYYLLGTAVEVGLLAAILHYAWTWPKQPDRPSPAVAQDVRPADVVG